MPSPTATLDGSAATSRRREAVSLGVLTGGSLAVAALVAVVDPNEPGHYPTCPFLAVTGLFCPGCGSMRAIHALTHGDVAAALSSNPFAVVAAVYLVLLFSTRALRLAGRPAPSLTARPAVVWVLLGVLVVFGVLRNLPGLEWLAPA